MLHGTSDIVGNVVELCFAKARIVGGVGKQLPALGVLGLFHEFAQILEQTVHGAGLLQTATLVSDGSGPS